MKKAFVKITWNPASSGGRKYAPHGASYIAVAKFQDQSREKWLKNAWSVRLEFLESENDSQEFQYAFARFIAPEAPHERLMPDTTFELLEGPKQVAYIRVLLSEQLIEKLVAHAA